MSVCRLPKVGLLVAAGHPAVAERELGRARCCSREDGGAAGAGSALAQCLFNIATILEDKHWESFVIGAMFLWEGGHYLDPSEGTSFRDVVPSHRKKAEQ